MSVCQGCGCKEDLSVLNIRYDGQQLECISIQSGDNLLTIFENINDIICTLKANIGGSLLIENVGSGAKMYKGVGTDSIQEFRSLISGPGITVNENTDEIQISATYQTTSLDFNPATNELTSTFVDGTQKTVVIAFNETLTSLSYDSPTKILTYVDEDSNATNLDLSGVFNETLTTIALQSGDIAYTDENSAQTIIPLPKNTSDLINDGDDGINQFLSAGDNISLLTNNVPYLTSADQITLDLTPTDGSTNGVESNGIYDTFQQYLALSGGTMTGDISMGGNDITNITLADSDTFNSNRVWTNSFQIKLRSGTDNYRWNLLRQTPNSVSNLVFQSEVDGNPGTFITRYTLNYEGTPTISTDLITKGYADSTYLGGGSSITIEDEDTVVAVPTVLNFVGAGVTATDAGSGQVDVTITGGVTLDLIPTDGSTNGVESNGIFDTFQNYLLLTGGTMTGDIDMGTNDILNATEINATRTFVEGSIVGITGVRLGPNEGDSGFRWSIYKDAGNDKINFAKQTVSGTTYSGGSYSLLYTLNASGTPSAATDLITKGYADANYTGGGGGATDLSYVSAPSNGVVESSTGTNATIPAGSTTNASLMLPADKTKLDGLVSNATHTGDVTGSTILTISNDAVTTPKIDDGAVTSAKMSLTGVTAGSYNAPNITVDLAGRITSITASSGYVLKSGDTMTGPLLMNGQIIASSALLQVNGFMRTGDIYIHEGGDTPSTSSQYLRNVSGSLFWGGNRVWHSGNDGTGSDLDADLLDGVQGNNYARTDIAEVFTNDLRVNNNFNIGNSNNRTQIRDNGGGSTIFSQNSGAGSDAMYLRPRGDADTTFQLRVGYDGVFTFNNNDIYYVGNEPDFADLGNKGSGTGDYSTSGNFQSGRGSGGVALTINDGQGNANVTFNHADGVAEQAGNVGRIIVNTDSTTGAQMSFEIANNASAGAVSSIEKFVIGVNGATFVDNVTVPDEVYGSTWNGSLEVPTKNAVYDKIESLGGGSGLTQTTGTDTLNYTASVFYAGSGSVSTSYIKTGSEVWLNFSVSVSRTAFTGSASSIFTGSISITSLPFPVTEDSSLSLSVFEQGDILATGRCYTQNGTDSIFVSVQWIGEEGTSYSSQPVSLRITGTYKTT